MIDSNTEWPFLLGGIATNCRARVHTHVHLHLVRVLQVGNGSGKVSEQGRGESRDRKGGKKKPMQNYCSTLLCDTRLQCLQTTPFTAFVRSLLSIPLRDFQ